MKVFIDIVANHTAWDSVLIDKHADWYTHDAAGQIIPPNPDWVDVADLDYSKPALRQYMSDMLVRWLRDYDLDGFRCDYASWRAHRLLGIGARGARSRRPARHARRGRSTRRCCVKAFDIDYAWDFYHARE